MLIPLCRDRVASLDLVFNPNQLKSLNSRLRRSWPSSAARSVNNEVASVLDYFVRLSGFMKYRGSSHNVVSL